jgi:hypothetical protein
MAALSRRKEEIMAKKVSAAHILWIDADPVFGGSRSQVQFPVELRGFFSLPSNPTIGEYVSRSVHCAGLSFPGKKMDFHHNDVWRLNLPTTRQGLGGYAGKLLVFEKTSDEKTYLLWAVKKKSSVARKLRSRTASFGKAGFKFRDNGTKRRYGYF